MANQIVPNSIGDNLNDAHRTCGRMESRLEQLLSDLTGATSNESRSPGGPVAITERAHDLTARLNGIASMIERVQELVTGNPDLLKPGVIGRTMDAAQADFAKQSAYYASAANQSQAQAGTRGY